jgi:hypothetical protein
MGTIKEVNFWRVISLVVDIRVIENTGNFYAI